MKEELNGIENSVVTNDQPIKNNSNKKLFIIIGIVVVVLVVVGIFVGKSLLTKKGEEVVDKYAASEITGEVELAMKSTDKISRFVEYNKGYRNLEYFTGKDKDGDVAVFDAAGNILLPVKWFIANKSPVLSHRGLIENYIFYWASRRPFSIFRKVSRSSSPLPGA